MRGSKSAKRLEFNELVNKIITTPDLSINCFAIGATLGTGTFGRVRQVQF